MVNFTLDELADFSRDEKRLINEVMGTEENNPLLCPRKSITNNILNYSKASSFRSSAYVESIDLLLN